MSDQFFLKDKDVRTFLLREHNKRTAIARIAERLAGLEGCRQGVGLFTILVTGDLVGMNRKLHWVTSSSTARSSYWNNVVFDLFIPVADSIVVSRD